VLRIDNYEQKQQIALQDLEFNAKSYREKVLLSLQNCN